MKDYGIFAFGGGANDIFENFEKPYLYDTKYHRIAIDSDINKLETINADIKIQIGKHITKGHGCGSNSNFGEIAFEENKYDILSTMSNYEKVFIIAFLGGGLGTGCINKLSECFYNSDKRNFIFFLTRPFSFEGKRKNIQAQEILKKLIDFNLNTFVIGDILDFKVTFKEAYKKRNVMISNLIKNLII